MRQKMMGFWDMNKYLKIMSFVIAVSMTSIREPFGVTG